MKKKRRRPKTPPTVLTLSLGDIAELIPLPKLPRKSHLTLVRSTEEKTVKRVKDS